MTPTDQRSLRERLFGSRAGVLPVLAGPQASLHRARALTRTEGIPAEIATEAAQLGQRLGAGSLLAADPIRMVSTYLASVGGTPAQRELLNRLIWQEYLATRCPGRDLGDLANLLAASPAEVLADPFRALGTAAETLLAALAARPLGDQRAISASGAVVQAEKQLRQEALEGGFSWFLPERPHDLARMLTDWLTGHERAVASASAAAARAEQRELDRVASARREQAELAERAQASELDEERQTAAKLNAEEGRQSARAPLTPAPAPQPFGVSHLGAETLVREWMRHLGEECAEVTQATRDGGIDVIGDRWVAQVKNYVGSVGAPEVQAMVGAASGDGRRPLFFTSGTFTADAVTFAEKVGLPLLRYSAERGTLTGVNAAGRAVVEHGL